VNLIEDHNKSRNEYVVNLREYSNVECVLPEQHIRNSELTVYLQNHIKHINQMLV
jgi:hypothetical protein